MTIGLSIVAALAVVLAVGQGLARAGDSPPPTGADASAGVPILGDWRVAPGSWVDTSPAVARGAGCYLAVWESGRTSAQTGTNVYGLCTDSDGSPTYHPPIPICTGVGNQYGPAVAASASGQFLVAWCDNYYAGQADIYGRRVDSFGNLVGGEIPICLGVAYEQSPQIAYNSSSNEYLVVWEDTRALPEGRIYGRRVAHDGTMPTSEFVIAAGSGVKYTPAVAYSGTLHRYMVTWSDLRNGNSDVYGRLLFEAGTPDGGEKIFCTAAGDQDRPKVCLNGFNYEWLVVWQDERDLATNGYDVRGRRLTSAGNPTSSELVIAGGTGSESAPAVVYDTNTLQFLVAWEDYGASWFSAIRARWINGDGTFPGASFSVASTSTSCYDPALCYYHSGSVSTVLAVWTDWRGGDGGEIFAQRVNDDSSLDGQAFGVSKWSVQYAASLAHNLNNNEYLLVWQDQRGGKYAVWGRRLDGTGRPIGSDFPIASGTTDQTYPDVAYNAYAGRYLVVWTSGDTSVGYDVWGQLIQADGSLIGGNFGICTAAGWQAEAVVASSNSDKGFLVAWAGNGAGDWDIYGRLVNNDGSFGSSDLPICVRAGYQDAPTIAYAPSTGTDSDVYLVVWTDDRNGTDNRDVYGRRVFRTGTLDTEFPVATDLNHQEYPSIAYNSTDNQVLVAWTYRSGSTLDIGGRLMNPDGSGAGSPFAICTEGHVQLGSAVAGCPVSRLYLVVWQDERSGGWDVYGRHIGWYTGGFGSEFVICAADGTQNSPDLAYSSTSENYLVTWADARVWWRDLDVYARQITGRVMPYDIFLPMMLRYYSYLSALAPESLATGVSAAGLAVVVALGLWVAVRRG